jgi:hypothetical protein
MQNSIVEISIRHDMDDDEYSRFLILLHKFIVENCPITTKKDDVLVVPK